MSKVVVALLVGALLGVAAFLFLRRDAGAPIPGPAPMSTAEEPLEEPDSIRIRSSYVSPAQPGLLVQVLRGSAPEPGARVELSRAVRSLVSAELVWEPAGVEKTNATGRAAFPAMAGRYFAVATAADGARAVEAVDVSRGASMTQLRLTIAPPKKFSGQVIDFATRQPVAGALVRADPQTDPEGLEPTVPAATTTSDSLGRFGFELPDQRFRFEAHAAGYLANAAREELGPAELLIELNRGVRISGLVVDEGQQPVADATVRITPGDVTSLVSDREGRFSFTAAREPTSLHALAPDGRQGLARLSPGPKAESDQVRIVIGGGFELSGVVRDENGPVAQADVRILAEPESLEVAAFGTGLDGHFAAKGLPKGRYSVRAQQGTGRRATAVGLELPGTAPIELTLSSAGRVRGLVVDGDGRPAVGATVTLHWPKGLNEVKRTARIGEDGHYEFDDLLPSETYVQATLVDLFSEEATAYVAPGATVELNLTVAMQGRLVGTVKGRPIDGVVLRRDQPGGEFVKVDKTDGHFDKLLPPGTYRIFAEIKGDEVHAFQFIESLTATVRAGETTTVVLEVPPAPDSGQPAPGYRLHDELGSGLSFENSPGGVRVDFLMADCPAAKAGVRIGDLVVSIDGEATRDALDAFAKVRKRVSEAAALELLVRRDGQDLELTVR